jgi:hypothetical protein
MERYEALIFTDVYGTVYRFRFQGTELSVTNCQSTGRNIPEESRPPIVATTSLFISGIIVIFTKKK